MEIRVCVWLLLHIIAAWLPCSATESFIRTLELAAEEPVGPKYPEGFEAWNAERDRFWTDYKNRKYFYVHNEAHIAMARAEALHGGGELVSPLLGVHVPGTFPDFTPSEDGCYLQSAQRHLSTMFPTYLSRTPNYDRIVILAVDSCATERNTNVGFNEYELCSQQWVEKPDILIRSDSPRSFNVLVRLSEEPWPDPKNDILAEGVYFPATGKMHLVGCLYKSARFLGHSRPPLYEPSSMTQDYSVPTQDYSVPTQDYSAPTEDYSAPPQAPELSMSEYYERMMLAPLVDPDTFANDAPPLNSSTPEDCAISVTLQYPALHARWNRDRVLRYDVRSKRERSDPLYFDPVERSIFYPYPNSRVYDNREVDWQRRVEIWGWIVLLVLGLVCLALQIEHGRENEEALPFVSLVMVGIQLAHHFSQTSILKDLQTGVNIGDQMRYDRGFGVPDYIQEQEFDYYRIMAWSEHIPYQAMAMAAIFMYAWIFHRVGDQRRIMSQRVRRKRPGARDAPSEWRVLYATLAFFALVCLVGFLAMEADRHGDIRRALTGTTSFFEADREQWRSALAPDLGASDHIHPRIRPGLSYYVPWRFYELWQARWGIVNKLTGLVVSLFLVPQLLGNALWEVQGRPLSAWFYAGIPLLQSLPHVFNIVRRFELLPILSFYDPYFNSLYGAYQDATDLWWHIGVVVCSAAQVLVVHVQFSRSLYSHSNPKSRTPGHVQTCGML